MIRLKSNAREVIGGLVARLEKLDSKSIEGSVIIRSVAFDVLAEMKHRIQNEGKATSGGSIGSYSTKPLYISKKSNPVGDAGLALGKEDSKGERHSVFKSGKPHTSVYFPRGYKQYKTQVGRNVIGTVNLTLTGTFMNLMNVYPTDRGWGIGWPDGALFKRAVFFESGKKYGKRIFGASVRERKIAVETAKRLLNSALS